MLEDERQEEEEIVDPEIPPKTRTTLQSRAESEFAEEFRYTEPLQIAATAISYADTIRKVAERSENLKGTWIKELKEAAAAVAAAVDTLARKTQTPQAETVEETIESFRKEIKELKYQNKKMQLQLTHYQKELRERDEFPILLPPLAAREKDDYKKRDGERKVTDTYRNGHICRAVGLG